MLKNNHVDRMLELAEKYSQEGNEEKSNYWLDKADKFEQWLNKQKENK